ncbi:intracellular septation protein [Altererythrobacter atlanticus]|uniref:Inner membrane-spanning protein YciB n=1 Tax=Croceibacterium atlanticum TaxID=1267766 RepID=A0A0F7KRM3_9SPHN|nr:inner membrane-spanning protein YciB [Croceibacterium atlanticum]AKH41867.1 Intracellular septation protein [Croceibacterium atlanticum]MBB5733570.1 intracellular septation protein [Croceibacterium atlanticum]
MADETKKKGSGWLSVAIDYGPLIAFLGVYWLYAPEDNTDSIGVVLAVVRSTGAFIVAALIALALSKFVLGTISRMLMLSTVLIVGFGGLTILLRDPFYVQIKPTVLYLFFGAVLLAGWMRGKALLQWLLEAAFEGLSDEGWLKLSRNWAIFFFFLAALNEAMRLYLSFGDWLTAKVWVFMPLSFLFTFSQLPMLLRHGLAVEKEEEVVQNPPFE